MDGGSMDGGGKEGGITGEAEEVAAHRKRAGNSG